MLGNRNDLAFGNCKIEQARDTSFPDDLCGTIAHDDFVVLGEHQLVPRRVDTRNISAHVV